MSGPTPAALGALSEFRQIALLLNDHELTGKIMKLNALVVLQDESRSCNR